VSREPGAPAGPHCGAEVSVIVLNWNGREYLESCLPALLAQTYANLEIIVVDNGSTDGSRQLVRESFPGLRLIESPVNLGFAAGNNLGLRAARGSLVALLNNDAFPEPDWLQNLVTVMESSPRIGSCASRMVLDADPGRIDSAGIEIDLAGFAWDRLGGRSVEASESSPTEVFGACAGAALYRRVMLDDVGILDEGFFAYLEDVDLAWRGQWAGWQCMYAPGAVVRHVHSATAREGSRFKSRLLARNKIWLLCKNHPLLPRHLPVVFAYDLMALGYSFLTRHGLGALQGRLSAVAGIPKMLAKRRRGIRRISAQEMAGRMRPPEWPWVVRRRYAHLRRGPAEADLDSRRRTA